MWWVEGIKAKPIVKEEKFIFKVERTLSKNYSSIKEKVVTYSHTTKYDN